MGGGLAVRCCRLASAVTRADNRTMTLSFLGDTAVVLSSGEGRDDVVAERVREVAQALAQEPPDGVLDVVPAFTTVTVFYDLRKIADFARFCVALQRRAEAALAAKERLAGGRTMDIPVCYEADFAPDLAAVAERSGLSEGEVVARHSGAGYRVQAIGFAPGFPYLSGLPAELHTPRRTTPRTRVPAGSVAIGGAQTGIYSVETPGGWNVIGRTPLVLFDPQRAEPALLRAGDEVRFRTISGKEFATWK